VNTPGTNTPGTNTTPGQSRTLLDAGAILPPGTLTGDDVDTLTVRTYTHAVLPDRPIVRLVPATLGDAEDLALGFLGLTRDDDVPQVGQVRREALGFPAWALVNDPANGHHALALVRDIERLDRQAKTKPGSAKDGLEALATRLGRAVPHFLPTFHEQAARIFLKHDNTTYASAFFGKAREAERVHNLAIEEERLRAVFLEFAFAGALTAKALKEHAKALSNRLGPREAWAQFRQLAVERCTAGMPPYAGLAEDARALIRAAGGDTETEERALLRELLATPAIARAPISFWKVNRKPLAALATAEPDVRRRLLEILPTPGGSAEATDLDGFWLDLLADAGVVALLIAGDELEPGARAQWVSRWNAHRQRGWSYSPRCARTLDLVTRMAEVLRAEKTPVTLFTGNGWRMAVDVDLLDLVLAERIPLAAPSDTAHIDLDAWWSDENEGRRDLAAVAADPGHEPILRTAVGACKRHPETAAHPVLRPVLAAWLTERAAEFTAATGLPAAERAFQAINTFRDVVADVTPEVVDRVRAFDASALLATTLRAGVYDELGWPALDEAAELLGAGFGGNVELCVEEAWPALVLSTKKRAIVVGPDGILFDHEPRLPKDHNTWQQTRYRYVDGQLLVAWYNKNYDWEGYWSSRPNETFLLTGEGPHAGSDNNPMVSLALPDGGRATGERPLHAGDTKLPSRRPVLTDGVAYWSLDRDRSDRAWTEYDPATGTHGRASLPAHFAAAVTDGGSLIAEECELLPLRPGLEQTPFGTDGALLGRWVRVDGDTVTAGSVDGTTVTIPARDRRSRDGLPQGVPLGALRLPGGAAPTAIANREHVALWAGDVHLGDCTTFKRGKGIAAGSPLVPPRSFWHALRPRDESGSLALRALTPEQAAELVVAVQTDYDRAMRDYDEAKAAGLKPNRPAIVRVDPVRNLLPEVTQRGLLFGVASLTRETAQLAERLRDFGKIEKKKPRVVPTGPEHGSDNDLREAVSGVIDTGYYGTSTPAWTVLEHITSVARTLAATDRPQTWTTSTSRLIDPRFGWHALLDQRAGVVARALSPFTSDAHRASLLLILEALATGPLGDPAGKLRRVVVCEPNEGKKQRNRKGHVLRRGDRTVIFLDSQYSYNQRSHWLVLDHDPSGTFEAIDGFNTHEEHRYTEPLAAARITALVREVREHGPVPIRPEAVQALVEGTGLGRAEASVLLAGLPADELDKDQRAILRLKVTEARNARAQLDRLDHSARARVLAALVPAEPDAVHTLWTTGFDIAAATRAWDTEFGRVLRLPEDVAADLRGPATYGMDTVLAPESQTWITGTSTHKLDKEGQLRASEGANVPGSNALSTTVAALAWLAYRLPYGDPLRAQLPHVLGLLRKRLADPDLVVDLDIEYAEGKPTAPRVREAAGLAENGGADADGIVRIDDRLLLTPWYNGAEFTYVRPAGFTGADDPWFDRLIGLRGESSTGLTALRRILDPAFERLLAADGPAGLPQDPTHVVPELVAKVAKTHGIGEDAAALYLQLLALPDPTDRQVARWTGWKPARLKKARAELAGTDLVVEAKRERAGRTLFLPGGWNALRSPQLPIETWKDGLYDRSYGSAVVPASPVPDLFRSAWQRVLDGDAPGFEQLVTRTSRKGRR
jgi:hypothetical protein